MNVINIARDFTTTPGARFKSDGPYSGEEFREAFLERLFVNPNDRSDVTIILDGTSGYGTSFLEEAFGGLARKVGKEVCLNRLKFISNEEPLLVDEIRGYINDSSKN